MQCCHFDVQTGDLIVLPSFIQATPVCNETIFRSGVKPNTVELRNFVIQISMVCKNNVGADLCVRPVLDRGFEM